MKKQGKAERLRRFLNRGVNIGIRFLPPKSGLEPASRQLARISHASLVQCSCLRGLWLNCVARLLTSRTFSRRIRGPDGGSSLRQELTPPEPDNERPERPRIWVSFGPVSARFEYGTIAPRGAEQFVAHRKLDAMIGRHFHQAARHIDRVARRRDVVITSTAEPGGDDRSEMRADLESKP